MSEFLCLKDNTHFVKGPVNAAIYDLQTEGIQHVPKTLAGILEACIVKGMTVNASIEAILSGTNPAEKDRMRDLLIKHPLLSLSEVPHQYQPVRPLMDESLKMIWLELTPKCNLKCLHCYAGAGPDASSRNSLSTEKWKEIIQEAAEMGFSRTQFTGGEPLLYPELVNLINTTRKSGYELIEVYSNLTLLTDELAREFKSSGVSVATSFYSHDRQTHNEITQNRLSYGRTVKSIKKIVSMGIPIRVGVILMEQNMSHAEKTKEFLKELGVPEGKIGFDYVRCSGRGGNMPHGKDNFSPTRFRTNHQGQIVWNSCWTGKIAVKSDGSVSPCVFVREAVDTVKEKRLKDVVLDDRLKKYWGVALEEVEVCKDCEFRYGCFDCRANIMNYTGHLYARNPLCNYDPYTGIWEGISELRSDLKPAKKPAVQWEKLNNRAIIYDPSGGFSLLNSTGLMVWELCDGKHSIEDIAEEFLSIYEADPESIYTDVKRMIEEFTIGGFLEREMFALQSRNGM